MILSLLKAAKEAEWFVKLRLFKVTILQIATSIAGNYITGGISEERFSGKNGVVKVRNFPGIITEDMKHNLGQ